MIHALMTLAMPAAAAALPQAPPRHCRRGVGVSVGAGASAGAGAGAGDAEPSAPAQPAIGGHLSAREARSLSDRSSSQRQRMLDGAIDIRLVIRTIESAVRRRASRGEMYMVWDMPRWIAAACARVGAAFHDRLMTPSEQHAGAAAIMDQHHVPTRQALWALLARRRVVQVLQRHFEEQGFLCQPHAQFQRLVVGWMPPRAGPAANRPVSGEARRVRFH